MTFLLICCAQGVKFCNFCRTLMYPRAINGPDRISAKMLKDTSCSIASYLTKLFNISIQSGSVPWGWKSSMIVPIPKDGEKYVPTNYRPISLLPIVSKILERHIHSKIMIHLQVSYPVSDKQWGFCAKKKIHSPCTSFSYG